MTELKTVVRRRCVIAGQPYIVELRPQSSNSITPLITFRRLRSRDKSWLYLDAVLLAAQKAKAGR